MVRLFKGIVFQAVIVIVFVGGSNAQSLQTLKEINQVWEKFCQAFDSLDHELMIEIHSRDLIRISGGKRITDYDDYVGGYERRFNRARKNNVSNNISLRFFERIHNDSIASERGVYRLERVEPGDDKKTYYGQFHVLLKKVSGNWKITMDYDSSEGNSIGEEDFLSASALHEVDKFIGGEKKE